MSGEQPWFERYFGLDYLRIYRLADTAVQVAMLRRHLGGLPAGTRLLDLPCGHGRHAVELATWGLQVTGLDLSAEFLTIARSAAAARGARVGLVRADMRALPLAAASFDAAICMFNSLGYFDQVADNQTVLDEFGRVVRPGGRLILDLANLDYVRRQPDSAYWEKDGAKVATQYEWHEPVRRAVTRRQVVFDDGRCETYESSVRLFEAAEIEPMLQQAGWQVVARCGSYDEDPLGPTSPRRILFCNRY